MRQSKFFNKTTKTISSEEKSRNAQFLVQGGFINRLMAGVYTFLPLGFKILKKIEGIIREEMNAIDGQEIYMPALHPLDNYLKTGRDKIEVLFHLNSQKGQKLVLGQSHEEVIVPLVKQYLSSYKGLPLYLYQIQVKFRNERRAKSGILRSREFIMKDLYSFHQDEKDLNHYYEIVKKAYQKIFKRVGIGHLTYLTLASGGTFSEFSHEFQTITKAGEDTIYLCRHCQVAINDELMEKYQNRCPTCKNQKLQKEKAIEVGNIFPLKTKFSEAFDLKYIDDQGKPKPVMMGCYGIGLGRLLGTVAEINCDKNGLIWPKSVTPFEVHLLGLENDQEIRNQAEKAYRALHNQGVEVLYDDRLDSAGVKLKDADLIGLPIRLIVSKKTKKEIELRFRSEQKIELVSFEKALKIINHYYQ